MKTLYKISFVVLSLILSESMVNAQCTVTTTPQTVNINCGQTIDLQALGLSSTPALQTDFDGGSIGAGWSATGVVLYNNPCGPSLDGTPSAWFGGVPLPRILTTAGFDLSCGGQVCFDFDMAGDENSTDCEDPDQTDEGVFFQYSIDGGATWVDIFYFQPTSNASGPYYSWANYCFILPPAAWTASTMFQWHQPNATDINYDHWGIDNVVITPTNCGYTYDWDNIPGPNNPPTQTVTPQSSTTYTVTYGDGTNSCVDSVVVIVDPLIADATTTDNTLICPNCADLNVEITNSTTGSIVDDFDPGIDAAMWADIENGTAGTGCGGMTGNGLHFDGTGTDRYAQTIPIDATSCGFIDFCMYLGNASSGGAPCENVDANENVVLEYSIDGGATFTVITTYDQSLWDNNSAWQCFTVPMPPPSQTPNTIFRWRQVQFSSCSGCDNWSIDDVSIACTPPTFDYVWTPSTGLDDPNAQDPNACPVAPTLYTATVTDPATGCSASDTVFIDVTCTCMFYNFTANVSECTTGNVFTVSGEFSYVENPGTGTIVVEVTNASGTYTQTFNPPFTNQSIDNYSISGIPADGSPLTVDIYFTDELTCTAQLTDNSPVTPDVISISGGDIYCPGEIVTDIQIEATGNGPWTVDYTIDGVAQSVNDANAIINLGTTEGVYTLTMVTDAGGCTTALNLQDSIELHVVPQLESFSGTGTYCADSTPVDIIVEVNGISPWTLDYTFNGTPQTVNSTDTIINLGNTEGTYELVHLYDANCDDVISGTETIVINPLPIVIAGQDFIVCDGDPAVLNGSGAVSYQWNNGVTNGTAFVPTQTLTYTVVGTDANGCQDDDSIVVTVEPLPTVQFFADSLIGCEPMMVYFVNTTPGNMVDCQWNFGDGNSGTGCDTVYHIYENGGTYTVQLETTSNNGCVNDVSYFDYIYVEDIPDVSFIPSLYSVITLSPEVSFDNNTTGAVNYIWNFDDGSDLSTEMNPVHTFPANNSGSYEVMLYAYSPIGCVDSTMTVIRVTEVIIFYIPNTFTPDGDEHNQTFQPIFTAGFDPYDFNLLIYNRWGEVVFESNNADMGWDGTYGGKVMQDGTYTWRIEFKDLYDDERYIYQGHVTLLR